MADVNVGVEEVYIYEMVDLNSETSGQFMYSDGCTSARDTESAHIANVIEDRNCDTSQCLHIANVINGAADDQQYETMDGNTGTSDEDEYTLARVCTSQATTPCTLALTTECAHIDNDIEDRLDETVNENEEITGKDEFTSPRICTIQAHTITGEDENTLAKVCTFQAHTITGEEENTLAKVCTFQANITPCVHIANANIGAEEEHSFETINENTIIMSNVDTDDYTLARICETQANTRNYCKRKECTIVFMTILVVIAGMASLGVILTLKSQGTDNCISMPCMNNATCVDGLNSYSCRCLLGYNGTNCEIDIQDCASYTCMNNATCVDGLNSCVPGYNGTKCELVILKSSSQSENSQSTIDIRSRIPTIDTKSKIARFFGNAFVRYEFSALPADMLSPTDNESLSLTFLTQVSDGLLWIFKSQNGQKMFIFLKDGKLLFAYDDSRRSPQTVRLPVSGTQFANNFRWHTLKIEKDGKKLSFFVDDQLSTEMATRNKVQFVSSGTVFLGGTSQTSTDTGGLVQENFDGALTNVESKKKRSPSNELIISFMQYVEGADRTGDIITYDPEDWNNGNWPWNMTRAPATPTPAPVQPTVTFTSGSAVFFLRDPLDMRTGGKISFRFRTLEPRGLIAIARGSAQSVLFFAIEVFDGILYFVFDLGSVSGRKTFADRRVDDGEWNEVTIALEGSRLTMTLNGRPLNVPVNKENIDLMYFYRLFVGGFDVFDRIPWAIYSRQGYKGCLESLKINDIGVNLHQFVSGVRGVLVGCTSVVRPCQTQPCVSGFCRERMSGYVCDCANTPYTGQYCNSDAVIAGWNGSLSTAFDFVNRESTHTNDISFRFLTHMDHAILFRTEADTKGDFIQAQLENRRVKVTIRADGQTKSLLTGSNLNDYFWHTLYIRRRANDVHVWIDDEPMSVGIIGGENYKLLIDRIKFGAVGDTGEFNANNFIGYMQNFIYNDMELFELLKKQNPYSQWLVNMTYDNLPLITYNAVTITTSGSYFQLPDLFGLNMKIVFKFKTRESNGLILYNAGTGNDLTAIELSNGKIRLVLGGKNKCTVVLSHSQVNDNTWHTVMMSLKEKGQLSVRVDKDNIDVSNSDDDERLDMSGALYIGGLPKEMFKRPTVTSIIESKKGFRGCLASFYLNGTVPELMNNASDRNNILEGCTGAIKNE